MNNSAIFSSLLFSAFSFGAPHSYYIIIHGTWSRPFSWHMPGGSFYDTLASVTPLGTVSFFLWSGDNKHESRVHAAKELVEFIQRHYPEDACINIIAHSHGSNVGILASQMMAQQQSNKHRISSFYALGTPTNAQSYMPNMRIIGYFYNLFSFNDLVQPVFGMFSREYPAHERIANLFITIDGKEPRHSELHHPLVAQWIPSIHEDLAGQRLSGFDAFDFKKPGIIHFKTNELPRYEIDEKRESKRERDQMILLSLQNIHLEMRKQTKKIKTTLQRTQHETQ